jgi:hypothetical protein
MNTTLKDELKALAQKAATTFGLYTGTVILEDMTGPFMQLCLKQNLISADELRGWIRTRLIELAHEQLAQLKLPRDYIQYLNDLMCPETLAYAIRKNALDPEDVALVAERTAPGESLESFCTDIYPTFLEDDVWFALLGEQKLLPLDFFTKKKIGST